MRFDKFTTKFQQAFADAQSLAVGNDNPYIEPQHLLLALLGQPDGGTASLLSRAGANVPALREALSQSLERLPQVQGQIADPSPLPGDAEKLNADGHDCIVIERPFVVRESVSFAAYSWYQTRMNWCQKLGDSPLVPRTVSLEPSS